MEHNNYESNTKNMEMLVINWEVGGVGGGGA